jgi:hypothetical protein
MWCLPSVILFEAGDRCAAIGFQLPDSQALMASSAGWAKP